MWNFDVDLNKWVAYKDDLTKSDYDFFKQELQSVRFYSKCLSGATYLPVNDENNIYDILGEYEPRNWYIGPAGSSYSNTLIPSKNPNPITATSSYEFYTKYLAEYGLTLKTHFTPRRIIHDSIKNYVEADVATTIQIDLSQTIEYIDGVKLLPGHKILVKNQKSTIVLLNTDNPDNFILGNYSILEDLGATIEYEYFDETNGLYTFDGSGFLQKTPELDDYNNCVRLSVLIKLGDTNKERQFHLSRLRNGYFPTSLNAEPMEFIEKKNWVLRNKVDYNNLFEINYFDVFKHNTQTYYLDGITYSIPERTLSVGEFGVIVNTQNGISNIIANKYKVNLRSISQTEKYYWICGDDGILLRVRKHDFLIDRIEVDCNCPRNLITTDLYSISFFNDLYGVTVGELNTILITKNGGFSWERLRIQDFDAFTFTQCLYNSLNNFFVAGFNGIFLEFTQSIYGWSAVRRRVSRIIDDDDEYVLVDKINQIFKTEISSWGLSYSFSTQSTAIQKELLFMVADDSKIIIYDMNDSINDHNFIYLDFPSKYGDIKTISRRQNTNFFYFSGVDPITDDDTIYSFDITDHQFIGIGNSYSNTVLGITPSTEFANYNPNKIFDYQGQEFFVCGNDSLFLTTTYSFTLELPDPKFESKLKSKMLFLDYDIGSKLSFYTDFGEYRLPNSVTFSSSSFSSTCSLVFDTIQYAAATPSFATQSETNWFTYWQDVNKTFEYYNTTLPLDESTKVLISPSFSFTSLTSSYTITSISTATWSIGNLAPTIVNPTASNGVWTGLSSRFTGVALTPITAPTASFDLYLCDYMTIAKFPVGYYSVEVGDVINFESSIVDSKMLVNKILTFGSDQYVYMFNDFTGQIIKSLSTTTYSITLRNLNKFSSVTDLQEKFQYHPLSNGYDLNVFTSSGEIEIKAKLNNYTAYYNLAANIELSGLSKTMSYTKGFLNFGYKPTYNLLDYLENLNDNTSLNPSYYATKEFYAMPEYLGLPLPGVNNFISSELYIDYNGLSYSNGSQSINRPGNQLYFGSGRKLEWDSLLLNTFVDVVVYATSSYLASPNYTTERLLITDKYFNETDQSFVIEFHKNINFTPTIPLYWIDIKSRRKLSQISEDLQELNNIQRSRLQRREVFLGSEFINYEKELNFRVPTDSYAKILLSDSEFVKNVSAIVYIDYKNELSLNITNLGKDYEIPILNTLNFGGKLFIKCLERHELTNDEGVVLEFNGGTGSSQILNQQYFGYYPVSLINDYEFIVDIPYGLAPIVGNDTGVVRYSKKDHFLNFQPVDLIDVGIDKKGKQSIELSVENVALTDNRYRLVNVDPNKLRFRLVDSLNVEILADKFPWILEAEISGAVIGGLNQIIWYKGTWECGRWFGGTWISGAWISGDWYGGVWNSLTINDNIISVEVNDKSSNIESSTWFDGRWYEGTWNNGLWVNGRWYGGEWVDGIWYNGIWNRGTWRNGLFTGGVWITGNWDTGIFNCDNNPSYWLDGLWTGGDFENGMWYNGTFDQRPLESANRSSSTKKSRFGTKAYNSRTATWHGGKWINGSFYSKININDSGKEDVSDVHKYSIWYTGQWYSGDWYGGIAYNMDFKSGTWYGGILDDIQIIGLDAADNYFVVNGIFKFNIGDEITVTDNRLAASLGNTYGNNFSPKRYTVLYTVEDSINKWTKVYVDYNIVDTITPPTYCGLWIVSRFRNANWKSGIWTNGIYEKGLWEGGIWYNGVFEATWL